MQTLNEALKHTQTTFAEQDLKSPMQPLGSISSAGQLITNPCLESKLQSLSKNQDGQAQQSKSSPKIDSPEEIEQFTLALSQACIMLKSYGTKPEELRTLRDGFIAFLPEFNLRAITRALHTHVSKSDEIPTPRQLRDIIEPPVVEWKPDWPAYIALKNRIQKDGYHVYGTEKEFLRKCEAHAIERSNRFEPSDNADEAVAIQLAKKSISYSE